MGRAEATRFRAQRSAEIARAQQNEPRTYVGKGLNCGTKVRTAGSYVNAVVGICMYGGLAWLTWGWLYCIVSGPFAGLAVLQLLGLAAELLTNVEPVKPRWLDTLELRAARTRAFARRQMREAASMDLDDRRRTTTIVAAMQLQRSLPNTDRSPQSLAQGASLLSDTITEAFTAGRPEAATAAARELEHVVTILEASNLPTTRLQATLTAVHARADEPRRCDGCGEHKGRTFFSKNQWLKTPRRCQSCQEAGVGELRSARAERLASEAEAAELAAIRHRAQEAERRRIEEELARRNAQEHTDDDCCICFDTFDKDDKCCLPCSAHHWLCRECLHDMVNQLQQKRSSKASEMLMCPYCRASVPDSAWGALL